MPDYPVGPGHETRSRGPVIESYVDTDTLDYRCPNCHAEPGDFCRHDNGAERKMPCPKRITAAQTAAAKGRPA